MHKSTEEKEALVAPFFPKNKNKPLVMGVGNITENGIFDSSKLLDLQSNIESLFQDGSFVIINDEEVNARAFQSGETAVIAIYSGTIKKILYDACLMMLNDEFLPEIGDVGTCFHDIKAENYPITDKPDLDKLKVYVSADPYREAIGYMIASLAIHFIVYHEVGHHKNGDIRKLKANYGISFYEEVIHQGNDQELEDRKKMELEADIYAMNFLINNLEDFAKQWEPFLGFTLTYSEFFQMLLPALVIVKEELPVDVYVPKDIEQSHYFPNMIRIALSLSMLVLNQEIKKVLYHDILKLFKEDTEFRQIFEKENEISVFNQDNMLTEEAYIQYCSLMVAKTEQIYCDIFIGISYPAAFRLDAKAIDWFLHMYK